MRFAVVSDVHGNLAALEAVIADRQRRRVEVVVHGGDLALMGARPAAGIDRIASAGWEGVLGNTDELLWRPDEHDRQRARAPKLAALLALLSTATHQPPAPCSTTSTSPGCSGFPPNDASGTGRSCMPRPGTCGARRHRRPTRRPSQPLPALQALRRSDD